jgi:putative DNA primase/helicase
MLALFSDASGKPATIHRTYLTGTGSKASVDPVRMFMPGKVPAGGAIRLYDAAEMMGIAEGIETALSAALMMGIPTWATTSANLLEQWKPPEIAKHVTIFADNDLNYVGQCAGYALAKRLIFEAHRDSIERTVMVMVSPRAGTDWNDQIGLEVPDAAR